MNEHGIAPLVVSNMTKVYGQQTAVDGVSFALRPGEIFGLLGPNGAGKTSIISTIVTLQEATSGSVEVFGFDVKKYPRQAKVLTGFVPQELINHGYFDVEEIMEFHSGYYGIAPNSEQIEFLLKRLDLWSQRKKRVKQLSGGMKRRLLIAKALVHKPKLLLLDEPTAGVDIELRASLWEFVCELQKQGLTILLTTHYLEEAERLCQRVGVLDRGKLKTIENTSDLIEKLTHREICIELNRELNALSHPLLVEHSNNTLRFRVPAQKALGELLSEIGIGASELRDVQIREGTLEEAFRSVLGQ